MPIKLGKQTFLVPAPGGLRSFALQQRILPIAARIASILLAVVKGSKMEELLERDIEDLLPQALPYLGKLFAEMPPGELEGITRELLRDAKFDGLPLFQANGEDAFDAVMAGRTKDTWKLLWHALQVWYPDFFALAAELRGKDAAAANPSETSPTSGTRGRATASSAKAGSDSTA